MLNCNKPNQSNNWLELFNRSSPIELIRKNAITTFDQYHKHVAKNALCLNQNDLDWIALLDQSIANLSTVRMLSCQQYQSQSLPAVQIPTSLVEQTPIHFERWLATLHSSTKVQKTVEHLLTNLSQQSRGFGCDYDQNIGWFPIGKLGSSAIEIASLTHEVSHCLVNNQWEHLDHNFAELIMSEFVAMHNELLIVLNSPFSRRIKQEFLAYQHRIDELNFYFFRLEWSLFIESKNCLQAVDHDRFKPQHLLLRETLWTTPGYQLVYAAASLLRRQQLYNHRSHAQNI